MVHHAIKGAWGRFPNKPHRELWHHDAPLAISERDGKPQNISVGDMYLPVRSGLSIADLAVR